MNSQRSPSSIELPDSLRQQLSGFQQTVWKSKMFEVFFLAVVGIGVGALAVFLLDRFFETSPLIRGAIMAITFGLWLLLPWAFHRWVWKHRRLDQVARLLRQKSPNFGDQLLGVIELAENRSEQLRSPALVTAAIQQVAAEAATRDLTAASPTSYHRRWAIASVGVFGIALALFLALPAATWNAVVRYVTPWRQVDRYTFAQVERLPERLVVPHGESFTVKAALKSETRWSPEKGIADLAKSGRVETDRQANQYEFVLPSLSSEARLDLRIGDFKHRMAIEPKTRPELTSLRAVVRLPSYLERSEIDERDLRGGSMNVVAGSQVVLQAVANRNLQTAKLTARLPQSMPASAASSDDEPVTKSDKEAVPVTVVGTSTSDGNIRSEEIDVAEGVAHLTMNWSDEDGLSARTPLRIALQGIPDAAPMVATEDLPRQSIMLNSEQLNFRILATDDFGVKQVGMEWRELTDETRPESDEATATKTLALGAPDQTNFVSQGTFRPIDLGIESKAIELRMWADDYFPGRGRSYSPPHRFLVLTPDEHAVWITEQLNKWHRQSMDVRDRELQLYQTNQELRALPLSAFADEKTRQKLEDQAAGEAANERRLRSLTTAGESLLRQAARNSEMGVGHLERWADVLKTLQDIAANRMPKVTDLLQQAARENKLAQGLPKEQAPSLGNIRNIVPSSKSAEPNQDEATPKPPAPSLVDVESSQQLASTKPVEGKDTSKPGASNLGLPTTVLIGPPQDSPPLSDTPAQQKTDEAVQEQKDLLAEFEKLADEMNKVLGELEGSTLVKRLKAASREQTQFAQELGKRIPTILSVTSAAQRVKAADSLSDLVELESQGSQKVSNIVDDLDAFYERRRLVKFRDVLKEMKESQVVAAIRQIGDELSKEQGMSIAQAEYWSDTMDRWAEDLVDPACKGSCPGGKNADSLPPSVVLEVLQIIEGQTNLREETRVTEQAKEAIGMEEHRRTSDKLAAKQEELAERVHQVVVKIEELPQGSDRFADEIGLLNAAENLMVESVGIFEKPETGPSSIAIQTEIIEWLLRSKRINPKSGGGGGKAPGGGGKGDTGDAALALLGAGLNPKEKREMREVLQTTGTTGLALPEEFRDGLNQYFHRLEQTSGPQATP